MARENETRRWAVYAGWAVTHCVIVDDEHDRPGTPEWKAIKWAHRIQGVYVWGLTWGEVLDWVFWAIPRFWEHPRWEPTWSVTIIT